MMTELIINDKRFSYFSSYSISLKHDAVASSFEFEGIADFLPAFLSYPRCEIIRDDDLLITGIVINESKSESPTPTLKRLSGYSLPGVLEDCKIPLSLYPLQRNNITLKELVNELIDPFGLSILIEDEKAEALMDKVYKQTTAEASQTIKDYIQELAAQRGLFITHNSFGDLVFKTESIAAEITEIKNILQWSIDIPGQGLHSEISVIREASTNNPDAGEATVLNDIVKAYRPNVKILSSGDIFDIEQAAKNELRAELSKIKLTIRCLELLKPGTIIKLEVEDLFNEWFVEQTDIKVTAQNETFTLSCVPKEVYF